jgi:uncharacterized caspase-like protein
MAGKRYGILIGVSDYTQVDGAGDLQYTVNDAKRLYRLLNELGDFDSNNLHLFCDGDTEDLPAKLPHRSDILETLQKVTSTATPEDLILFFFAGHGVEIQSTPYLLTNDARMNVPEHTALRLEDINGILAGTHAGFVLRIFDACRGAYSNARFITTRMGPAMEAALLQSGEGSATFSSCSSGEFALETSEFQQGLFSYFLCDGLDGHAADERGIVTLNRLVDYVSISMDNWAKQQSNEQTPHFVGDFTKLPSLTRVAPQPVSPPQPTSSPFAELAVVLDDHIRTAPSDLQKMTFTSTEQYNTFSRLAINLVTKSFEQLNLPTLTVSFGEIGHITQYSVNRYFDHDIQSNQVNAELASIPIAFPVRVDSNRLLIPSSELVIVVAQFKFFYWIWYSHMCEVPELSLSWKPSPLRSYAFFTFHPQASGREDLIEERAVLPIAQKVSENIIQWAKQLREYTDKRVQPLRDSGPIIE